MSSSSPIIKLCNLCKVREAITDSRIYIGESVSNYVIVAATITKHYLLIPTCEICNKEFSRLAIYRTLSGILAVLSSIYAPIILITELIKLKDEQNVGLQNITCRFSLSGLCNYFYICVSKNKKENRISRCRN